jgi:dienelactone hydrolase
MILRFLLGAAAISAALASLFAAGGQTKKDLATTLRELGPVVDPASDLGKSLPKMLAADIKARRDAINQADTERWQALKTREDWEKFKAPRLEALKRSLGAWPTPPKDLKIHVTKTLDGEGFFVDNLVFESRPGLVVTANLYRPAQPPEKMPGILICHSHHHPKTEGELQDMGVMWARQGCQVLVMDQLGHGERRQHPFTDASTYPEPFKVGRQDYYFRYNVGNQLHLVGESLMGWMVWDLMRGVDLLYQQKGIDKNRIILLGAVAGGGDPAAVTAALDERITAVAPFNFGGPQPETTYPLPDNADTSFNYLGSGSWESTRSLRLSGSHGFAPWVIVASIAPRRLVYGHEFAWDREHDPVWKRLQKVYDWYGVPENLAFALGRGKVAGQPPESTHCNNIGPEQRKGIHAALKKWFAMPVPDPEYRQRRPAADLTCLTADVTKELRPRLVHELAAEPARQRLAAAAASRAKLEAGKSLKKLFFDWYGLLRPNGLGSVFKSTNPLEPRFTLEGDWPRLRVVLDSENVDGAMLPMHVLLPDDREVRGIVLAVCQDGARGFLQHRSEVMASLLQQGVAVCLPDVQGTGETKPAGDSRDRAGRSTSLSSSDQMLDATRLMRRQIDLLKAIKFLGRLSGLRDKPFVLWGDSFAPVNPAAATTAAPLDAKQPAQSEPMGGLLAVLTALNDGVPIKGIYVRGGLVSYQSLLDSPFLHVPHDVLVPGALTVADLPDLVAALAPRPVRLDGLLDGLNRRVGDQALAEIYAPARDAYRAAKHRDRLTLHVEPASDEQLVQWFLAVLKQ